MSDLLSQEEIDALLKGLDEGDVEVAPDVSEDQDDSRGYDFSNQERIVRRRVPALEMIYERFYRQLRNSLFKFLNRSPEMFILGIKTQKFHQFINSLHVPSNLNIVRCSPLRGRALIVIEPNFIFTAVDNMFGGGGHNYNKTEGREFTPTESRIIQIMLEMIFTDLKDAWEPIVPLNFEYVNSELNPVLANIVSADDTVVVSTVRITLDGGGGNLYVVMPYAMIEPLKGLLDINGNDKQESDGSWRLALRKEVMEVDLSINSLLVEKNLSIREVLSLKIGDVIPIEMPKTVAIRAEGVPVFNGNSCVSQGYYAVQIVEKLR